MLLCIKKMILEVIYDRNRKRDRFPWQSFDTCKIEKKLGVKSKAKVFVSLEDDVITIALTSKYCALCGNQIGNEHKLRLCSDCILKIQSEASVEKD